MSFTRPEILLFLWGVLILGVLFWRSAGRRRRILAAFASPRNLAALAPGAGRGEWIRRALFLAAFACCVFALSGPRRGYVWETVPRRGASIMLALDVSRSMLARDMVPDRLKRAKREIRDLLSRLGGERAGLTAFAGTAFISCPLTVDYAAFDLFLDALTPDNLPVGGTDLAGAVDAALSGFDPEDSSRKSIVLFTDGEGADPEAAMNAARKAAAAGVRLFAVGLGQTEGAPIPEPDGSFKKDASGNIVMTRREDDLLRRMTETAGGAYAVSTAGDEDIDALLAKGLGDGLASKAAGETRIQVFKDRFQWFLGAGVLFLALELFFPALSRRRGAGTLLVALACAGAVLSPRVLLAGAAGEADKGLSAYAAGDFGAARERFLTAQVLAPESARAAYDAGCAAYRLGRFEEARKLFAQAAELAGPAPSAQSAGGGNGGDPGERNVLRSALYNQGNALFRAENLEGAAKAYEEALAVAPEDPKARANLEYVRKLLEKQKNDQDKQNGEDQDSGNGKQEKQDGGQGKNDKEQPQDGGKKGDTRDKQDGSGGASDKKDQKGKEAAQDQSRDEPREQPQDQPRKEPQEETRNQPNERQHAQNAQNTAGQEDGNQAKSDSPAGIDETMLNRLKDLPGMPQPPRYGRPDVTRDW